VRKYDLLAIGLLMLSIILVTAMVFDPKGFSIKEWQPLMAAFVAVGAAGIAYQGATLAYRASMHKVNLDRSIQEREVRRRQRGIYLRTALAAHIMHHCCQALQGPHEKEMTANTFYPTTMIFRIDAAIDDAWQNLDAFSRSTADDLLRLKVQIYNYERATNRLGGLPFDISHSHHYTDPQKQLRNSVMEIRRLCLRIRDTLRSEEIVVPHT
jgi:hypothetical protein